MKNCLRSVLSIPLLLVVVTSCASVPASSGVIDADGVEILTCSEGYEDFSSVGTVTTDPDLDLIFMDPEDPLGVFGAVAAIRSFPDGSFLVADGSTATIGLFEEDGTAIERLGALGEAPGEFRTLSAIPLVTADTVWVWDEMASRLTTFPREGGAPAVRSVIAGANSRFTHVHVLPDRRLLALARARTLGASLQSGANLPQRDSVRFTLFDANGRLVEPILSMPGEEWLQMQFGAQDNFIMTVTAQLPLGRNAAHTLVPGGILGGANDRFEVNLWDLEGRLVRTSRFPGLDVPLTEEEVSSLRDRWIEEADGIPERIEHIEAVFQPELIPDVKPAFSRILSDRAGRVWIEEYDPWRASGLPRWWLFDEAGGDIVGYLEVPEGLEVHEFGEEYILGVFRDETGLPHVRRHTLNLRTP